MSPIPNGQLYAMVMDKLSLEQYNRLIGQIVSTGVVKLENNLLYWVGFKS